jgi:pimeloyl-ACP methyl ester carboxylesterase
LVNTRLGAIECALYGEGPSVLALHGAMGGYDQSMLLTRAAVGRPDFRYVCVSRPGYLATKLALGATPHEQADRFASVLDTLAIDRTAVLAISGGGQSAVQFALRHPDRCWGLVMISACNSQIDVRLPFRFHLMKLMAQFPSLAAAMSRKAARDPDAAARRSILDPALRARTLADPEAGPLLRALQASTMDRMAQRLPGTMNDIAQSRAPFAYPLQRIGAPVLVVHGTADEAVPFAQAALLANTAPAAELLTIPGGTHVSLFTHLHEIRSRVARFLETHAPITSAI